MCQALKMNGKLPLLKKKPGEGGSKPSVDSSTPFSPVRARAIDGDDDFENKPFVYLKFKNPEQLFELRTVKFPYSRLIMKTY